MANEQIISGTQLIEWGYKPGPLFPRMLKAANHAAGYQATEEHIRGILNKIAAEAPVEVEKIGFNDVGKPYGWYLPLMGSRPLSEAETTNNAAVLQHMDLIMRLPPVVSGAVMPDACPAGSQLGTIPVGGVVATKDAIFPGMHSADVCCSVMASYFPEWIPPANVLDMASAVTHFGPGGRGEWGTATRADITDLLHEVLTECKTNPFLKDLESLAIGHFMTQGDGNHFLSVGVSKNRNTPVLVTHHGSRGFGAQVYKRGQKVAIRQTRAIANIPDHMAWIDANSEEGQLYWEALQIVRTWTQLNHYAIHSATAGALGYGNPGKELWTIRNEHNFVFKRNGLFYHAKGSTPSYWRGPNGDADRSDANFAIIPMNMSKPILIVIPGTADDDALGFAPHGAGRNESRTSYLKSVEDQRALYAAETEGLDVRWFSGKPDLSECGSAYKSADLIRETIEREHLANIVDEIKPYGCIMAGEQEQFWKKKEKK